MGRAIFPQRRHWVLVKRHTPFQCSATAPRHQPCAEASQLAPGRSGLNTAAIAFRSLQPGVVLSEIITRCRNLGQLQVCGGWLAFIVRPARGNSTKVPSLFTSAAAAVQRSRLSVRRLFSPLDGSRPLGPHPPANQTHWAIVALPNLHKLSYQSAHPPGCRLRGLPAVPAVLPAPSLRRSSPTSRHR